MRVKFRSLLLALMAAAIVTACDTGGYQRGIFTGFVTNATEEEVVNKIGKPDQIDASDPNAPRWIYNKKLSIPITRTRTTTRPSSFSRKTQKRGRTLASQ